MIFAGVAQLVERNLAKVEVAGSNPVSRSRFLVLPALTGGRIRVFPARWQSGYAADCNSVYAGSIPTRASNSSVCPSLVAGMWLPRQRWLMLPFLIMPGWRNW